MKSRPLIATRLLILATLLACNPLDRLHAQAAVSTPEQAAAAAMDLVNRGQSADAAAAYEKILRDYPTSTVVCEAQFRLADLYYTLGNYDKGIEMVQKVMAPPASPQIQEQAFGLRPQILSAKAAKLGPDDPKRTTTYEEAIRQFDAFLQKYPSSEEVESTVYAKALAQFEIRKYDDAVAGLRQNLARFGKSDSILESDYLLGVTLAAQEKYEEAEKCMHDILDKHTDLALANDAQIQLGEILCNHALGMEKAEREAMLAKAIEACRAVKSKEQMIKAQQALLDSFPQRLAEAYTRRDTGAVNTLQRLRKLQFSRMQDLKMKPDSTVSAQIQIGVCYFRQQKYDEACGLLLKMQELAQNDEQKKQIQYYLTLNYISQNLADKAVAAYDAFQSKYKGDPMAENLPVALGAMFLNPGINNPGKALQYLSEAQQIYPNGRYTAEAVMQKAAALLQLKRFEEAQRVYRGFLLSNPKRELAAAAELALAGISKDTGKLDEAVSGYKAVRDKYAGLPETGQASFWIGQLALVKGDPKTAAVELTAFLSKYPDSTLCPSAMYALAQAQQATGGKEQAVAGFKALAEKYPKSEAAPFSYFQRAAIAAADQKTDEMVALMKEFIEKYPKSDKIYYAFDTVGQSQVNAGKPLEAITTYAGMAEKYPENPQSSDALLKVASLWLEYARLQGLYTALNEDQRAEWNKGVANSTEAANKLLEKYPDTQPVAVALKTLLDAQKLLVAAKLKTDADLEKYFQDLTKKFAVQPPVKSKTLFTLAAFIYEKDKARALEQMNAAYDPKLVYASGDIDLYGGALIETGKLAEAQALFAKLAADYPIPPGVAPGKASPEVQEAQSIALYGTGKTLQKQGNVAGAGAKFDQLKQLYPWSPKILEANFGIAQSLAQQKKFDDATNLLVQIIRAPTATADLRANSMLLGGDIQNEKGNIEAAIDYYIKIATFYEGVPAAAAEGLWKGGQLLEKQAAGLTDTSKPTKSAQMAKAIKAYKDLTGKFAGSSFSLQAKNRLQQLGAK